MTPAPLHVGITATRDGLTPEQAHALAGLLAGWDVAELHHGDCVGGDAEADAIAAALGIPRVAHPPDNSGLRAYTAAEVVLPPEPYKARNRAIVLATCPLVGLPASPVEQRYGGTWGTVRYARGLGRPLLIVAPDGTITRERYHL